MSTSISDPPTVRKYREILGLLWPAIEKEEASIGRGAFARTLKAAVINKEANISASETREARRWLHAQVFTEASQFFLYPRPELTVKSGWLASEHQLPVGDPTLEFPDGRGVHRLAVGLTQTVFHCVAKRLHPYYGAQRRTAPHRIRELSLRSPRGLEVPQPDSARGAERGDCAHSRNDVTL